MLVECPRCHFKQPQDQYCANCGVDMLAFKQAAVPLYKKLFKSGLFQFILVALLGVAITYVVIKSDQPQQWIQKINRFASVNISQNTPTSEDQQDQESFEEPPPLTSASETTPTSPTEMAAENTAFVAETDTHMADIKLIEIENEQLNALLQQAHSANSVIQDAEIKAFALPISNIHAVQTLNSSTVKLKLNSPMQTKYGTDSRGFILSFTLSQATESYKTIKIQFNKIHPNDNLEVPLELNLQANEKLIISGNSLLSYFEFDTDLMNMSPFQIFKSTDFKNQKTTFAIIIELQ